MFRSTIISAFLACIAVAANVKERGYYEAKFYDWLKEHGVKPTSGENFVHMLQNFANNDDLINSHNAQQNKTYELGHNKFSHLSLEEWREFVHLGLAKPSMKADNIHPAPADVSALPASVDWTKTAVSAVKDQGQCGSCWSFSTTGAMEGAWAIKYGSVTSFSEQQLVDCDYGVTKNLGCNGGLMDKAFSWIETNNGLCTEAAYPYVSGTTLKNGACKTTCSNVAGSDVKSYTDVTTNSDSALMSAIAQQPVSVAIEADQTAFQLYKSGVLTGKCGTNLDHGVLAVGYGTYTDGTDYYKVKNSWGASWGMNGYILLQRGTGVQSGGQCGILMGPPSYPTLV
jgi:C1A family cysteine protease